MGMYAANSPHRLHASPTPITSSVCPNRMHKRHPPRNRRASTASVDAAVHTSWERFSGSVTPDSRPMTSSPAVSNATTAVRYTTPSAVLAAYSEARLCSVYSSFAVQPLVSASHNRLASAAMPTGMTTVCKIGSTYSRLE